MTEGRAGRVLAIMVGVITVGSLQASAGEESPAAARTRAMATLLAKTQRIGVAADCIYDVVQDSGQKIEFGERREVILRRPDRARFDVTRRDGGRRTLFFDGTQLTAVDLDRKVYATVPRPGTADAALAYYALDLGMRLPLREMFSADFPEDLKDALPNARVVGKETVGGVATDHVALRGDTADIQIWIARDGDPLPQRVAITYRLAEGQPQFKADFHDWNLSQGAPDSTFVFTPAPGAERIPIQAPGRRPEAGEKQP